MTSLNRPLMVSLICLVVFSSFLFLFNLGEAALWDYDEAAYAKVVFDTKVHNDFLSLHLGDRIYFDKPPLYFWLATASQSIFGHNEFSLRLPSAVSGVIAIVLTFLIALHIRRNWLIAALSGTILLTTGIFLETGRQVRLDVPVTASILFSFYCFLRGQKDSRWLIGMGAGLAIGVLIKSVIGLMAIPAIITWTLVHRDFRWLKEENFWYGVGAFFLVLLPWHIYEAMKYGEAFWRDYLFAQVIKRFGSNVNGGVSSNWDYFKYAFLYAFPWAVTFLSGLVWLGRKKERTKVENKPMLALGMTVLFIFIVFLFAKTKIFYYLLPIFPFLAIFSALFIESFFKQVKTEHKRILIGLVALLLLIGLLNVIYVGYNLSPGFKDNQLIANDERAIGLILKKELFPSRVMAFDYYYWDTIKYYSKGRQIELLKSGGEISGPFFMVIDRYTVETTKFPEEISKLLTVKYKGPAVSLLLFKP
jgi:4-amino-4-deoxy-L-arabinose transferase-like glycosyltransferase